MVPEQLFGLLSDATRLRALMLIRAEGELCVCELTFALGESQPKISRHLALMREAGLVEARREGTWMFYRMHTGLPGWADRMITAAHEQLAGLDGFARDLHRLGTMRDRPVSQACA